MKRWTSCRKCTDSAHLINTEDVRFPTVCSIMFMLERVHIEDVTMRDEAVLGGVAPGCRGNASWTIVGGSIEQPGKGPLTHGGKSP